MIKIVSVEQMRRIEQATDSAGVSYDEMMERAGRAVAEAIVTRMPGTALVLALVGPGNNGGDALVAARVLTQEAHANVSCYMLKPRGNNDQVYVAACDAGVNIVLADDDTQSRVLKQLVMEADVIIDGLLGTGVELPLRDSVKKLLNQVRGVLAARRAEAHRVSLCSLTRPFVKAALTHPSTAPLMIAVDCPSGLDTDTGSLDPATIPADLTVTFAAVKRGQLIFPGAEAVGELVVADIGIPDDLPELAEVSPEVVTSEDVATLLPARPSDGHKGTFGQAFVVAGSVNYTGAAALAGEAAYRVGAGLVTMAIPEAIHPILAALLPEAIWLLLPHEVGVIKSDALEVLLTQLGQADALLIGPGWGREGETLEFLRGLLRSDRRTKRGALGFLVPEALAQGRHGVVYELPPLVIDADGLNLLTRIEAWPLLLPTNTILTPHPGEMARLSGISVEAIQSDRLSVAARQAAEWQTIVVLKGPYTVIASPGGRLAVIPFASDALATGGTGDVLAGCIVGLLAQGMNPFDASVVGAYLHGLAGALAAQKTGNTRSVIARDVLHALHCALTQVVRR